MNCGMKCKIIGFRNYNDIDVQFVDGYIASNKNYGKFKGGGIHNKNLEYLHLTDLTGKRFGRWTVLCKTKKEMKTLKRK